MNHITRTRTFGAIVAAAFVFWLAETGYFGWNMHPQTHAERVCDQIVTAMFLSAWLAFVVPGMACFRAINPFRRVTWFYIEHDPNRGDVVSAHRVTRLWRALLLAGALWLLEKLIRACGVPSRLRGFLIVTRVVTRPGGSAHA